MPNPLHDALFAPQSGNDRPFLIRPGRGTISHDAFFRLSGRYAAAMSALGLEPGDRVAIEVQKSAEALALYAAAVRAGVVFLPLNPAYTVAEARYFIEDSGARLVICDPAFADDLRPVAEDCDALLATLSAGGTGSFAKTAETADEDFAPVDRGADDLAAFLYTSGTTGRSKGAMMSQRNLLSNARTLTALWQFTETDVLLHALPIFHTHGLFVATNVILAARGAMILLPRFDPDAVLDVLPQATAMMGVPTFYTRLLDDPRFDGAAAGHMRLFISGSAPLLAATHRAFEDRTGQRILERYGMTETNMLTSNPYDGERRAGTVGPALPGVELAIRDPETGADLPDGEIGMIEVRGDNVFQGYWQMPDKTAEDLRADGWFRTGDLGTRSPDGYVTIVGRGKDLVISGGYNVYPKEVEDVLDAVPGVLESAVIGVPHADLGEAPLAIVVAEPGASLDETALEAACADALARYKHPRAYVIADTLPRNTMGKVQKAALREAHEGRFA